MANRPDPGLRPRNSTGLPDVSGAMDVPTPGRSTARRYSRGGSRTRIVRYSPGLHHVPHEHELAGITLVFRGALGETVGGQTAHGEALSVVARPGGVRHAVMFGHAGADTLQIELSSSDVADLCREGELARWRWMHAGPASRATLAILPLAVEPESDPSGSAFDDRLIDLIASLRAEPGCAGQPPRWVEIARDALREPGTSVREAAALAGVHPVHLARTFRAFYGEGPARFRRRARLRRAAVMLTEGREDLAGTALACGFADQAHMTREARRTWGLSPAALRRRVASP